MATTYLSRTPGSTGNVYTGTLSVWVKKTMLGAEGFLFYAKQDANNQTRINFQPADTLYFNSVVSASNDHILTTNKLFRDCSGWYHIVVAFDTTESVAADRLKLYVNGVQQTFTGSDYPSENQSLFINESGSVNYIGSQISGNFFAGVMSHYYWIDGTAYAPTVFGQTDSDTGEWTINTSPTVTYGTNGFLIMKDGNTITDQGDNSNDWALGGGALTNTEDCPDDVFATGNNLPKSGVTFTNGNTTADNQTDDWTSAVATLGAFAGKYYAEYKIIDDAAGITRNSFGCCDVRDVQITAEDEFGYATNRQGDSVGWGGAGLGVVLKNGVDQGSGFNTTYTIGDIISLALDVTNGAIYFRKNADAWLNSGDPTSGATRTGAVTLTTGEGYCLGGTVYSSTFSANYGNGYFGTTAISSAGTNASGIGIFEYDVPTGYTALSTKGLQE